LQCGDSNLTLNFQAIKLGNQDSSEGLNLTQLSAFIFNFFNPILTCVKTNIPIFNQGILQGDTIGGSYQDA
jgi:hypothetical protein